MQNKILKTKYITRAWILINLGISLIYFSIWLSSIFYASLFNKLDVWFRFLPNLVDKILYCQINVYNVEISLSYLFVSIFFVTVLIASLLSKNCFLKLLNLKKENKKKINQKKEKNTNKKTIVQPTMPFFGLFEMNFEYLNSLDRVGNDLEKLKKEYFKILVNKLKEKYPDIQFIATNKIFIISNDFSYFDELVSDIVKIFAIFQKLNEEKFIGTNFLLSFEIGVRNTNHKKIYRLLSKVNDLLHYNQILVLEKFAKKYKYILEKKFLNTALGSFTFDSDDFGEINMDLYCLEINN